MPLLPWWDFASPILYPKGDLEQLDQAVESWVLNTSAYCESESVGSSTDGDPAELTADYSSYLVNEALVGVKLSGVFERPYLAHPVGVSASFNASNETGKPLTLADLLVPDSEDTLRNMVIQDAGIDGDIVDEHFHRLLTSDGLEITLVRGDYLPMSDGTVTLLCPYEERDGIISLLGISNSGARTIRSAARGRT